MQLNKPKMKLIKASELSEFFQTKKEFMAILNNAGNLLQSFPLSHDFIDYYVPPKRDVDYIFFKQVMNKEKKVRYFNKPTSITLILLVVEEG